MNTKAIARSLTPKWILRRKRGISLIRHIPREVEASCSPALKVEKIVIAITFFFKKERLPFLQSIAEAHKDLAPEIKTYVITNTTDTEELDLIRQAVNQINLEIRVPKLLGHPYLLTWCHREIFHECIESGNNASHFMYTEDDILVTRQNIEYYLTGMERLQPVNGIPGFLRFEVNDLNEKCCTDITARLCLNELPRLSYDDHYSFIGMPEPYQGMYILDRSLIKELLYTDAGSPDFPHFRAFGIREKAAQGLTYHQVPLGAYSRYFLGFNNKKVDPKSLIHHLPNNYANDEDTPLGKIPINKLFL